MNKSVIIAAIGLLAITGVSVRSQSHQRTVPVQHDVLILQGQGVNTQLTDERGTRYQWDGIALYNADSSPNAPIYGFDAYPYQINYGTNRMAREMAKALDEGFIIKSVIGDNYSMTVTLVRER